MTYRQICQALMDAKIEGAQYEARLLLTHFFGVDELSVRAEPEREYDSPAFRTALEERCRRTPLQYLLGEWDFYRQKYEVSPVCLIPRADTEVLVEQAVGLLPHGACFADLCTGSGCIAVSTLAERADTRAVGLEKFEATLELAKRNAQKNGVAERFTPLCADVLQASPLPMAPLDAILSNPPYIVSDIIPTLSPEVQAEPHSALDGGTDGLLFYRAILRNFASQLKREGFFLFEIGYDQADAVVALGRENGFSYARVTRDYGGMDRVVLLSRIPMT